MKKNLLLPMLMLSYFASYSQNVGIGTTTPDNSAQLDIVSNSRGLLIPRMTTVERTAITSPAKGLMVYDTETNGFWFYNGGSWTNMNSVVNAWSLTGNAGTDPSVNFIGTTDPKPLKFIVSGNPAGIITHQGSTSLGCYSLMNLTSGTLNTAFGINVLFSNTSGSRNSGLGATSLETNTEGYGNTAVGFGSLAGNTIGNFNIGIGHFANVGQNNLENATVIGAFSYVEKSNSLILGSINGINGATADVNVGIGTTTPDDALSIYANSAANGKVQLSLTEKEDDYSRIKFSNTLATSYWHIAGYPNNTAASARMNFYLSSIGDILSLHGDGNAWLRGSLTQNSDVTLKTNILQLTNLLPSIVALNGYRYHWKDHKLDQSVQIGLLAQEVEKYFPELVKKDSDGVLGVNYIGMIPVLIEGMKEQQQQIESLKESIQKLENLLHNSNLTKN